MNFLINLVRMPLLRLSACVWRMGREGQHLPINKVSQDLIWWSLSGIVDSLYVSGCSQVSEALSLCQSQATTSNIWGRHEAALYSHHDLCLQYRGSCGLQYIDDTQPEPQQCQVHHKEFWREYCNTESQELRPQLQSSPGDSPTRSVPPSSLRIANLQLKLREYLRQLLTQRISSISSFLLISPIGTSESLSQCSSHSGPVRLPSAQPRKPGHVSQQPLRGRLLHVWYFSQAEKHLLFKQLHLNFTRWGYNLSQQHVFDTDKVSLTLVNIFQMKPFHCYRGWKVWTFLTILLWKLMLTLLLVWKSISLIWLTTVWGKFRV